MGRQSRSDHRRWRDEGDRPRQGPHIRRAGADIALTDVHRPPEDFPPAEMREQWQGIESVAEAVQARGRRCLPMLCDLRGG